MEDTIKREVKEETGLSVKNIKFSGVLESIFPEEFIEKRHFIMMDNYCELEGGDIILNEELQEYKWIKPEEALKLNLNISGRKFIEKFLKDKAGVIL